MAIKKFTKINPSSWGIVDEMLKLQKTPEYKALYEVPEDYNIIYVEISKSTNPMRRGFCKCGNVYPVKEDSKYNLVYKCPNCGNNKPYRINLYYHDRELGDVKSFEVKGNELSFVRKSFYITESVIDEEVEIKCDTVIDATATPTEFKVINRKYSEYSFNDFVKTLPFKYEYMDSYFAYLRKIGYSNPGFSELLNLLKAKEKCPLLIKEIDNYPYLVVGTTFSDSPDVDKTTTMDDLINDFMHCPKEYQPLINKMFDGLNPRDLMGYYSYRRTSPGFLKERLNCFGDWSSIKTDELKQAMDYVIRHFSVSAFTVRDLLKEIKSSAFSEEEEKILSKHLLANYVSNGDCTISRFKSKVKFLQDNGYIVSEENLDKRNFNLLRHMVLLKNDGFSEERVSLFCDAFDLNPMTSIQYLGAKKAPAKKLRQEIEEKMDKKYS